MSMGPSNNMFEIFITVLLSDQYLKVGHSVRWSVTRSVTHKDKQLLILPFNKWAT